MYKLYSFHTLTKKKNERNLMHILIPYIYLSNIYNGIVYTTYFLKWHIGPMWPGIKH